MKSITNRPSRKRAPVARWICPTMMLCVFVAAASSPSARGQVATIGGVTFTNRGLVGVGRVPAAQRDKFGETDVTA